MRHLSIKLDSPVEFINVTPLNPLISKCQIKVCYVGDEPNRNRSIITKDVAREMANSLPGSPIVGFYNEHTKDFEEHNRQLSITGGELKVLDTTRPYGFVDLNAKVWFQKFLDDGQNEHEYLMTEGYLWTGQYPECQRIMTSGNNQSMELAEDYIKAEWTEDENGYPEFFIINEAIISKLCILGEEFEPCFEGSTITNVQFSLDEGFKNKLFSMMEELTQILKEGGAKMFNRYAVEIGDALWTALYSYLKETYADYNLVEVCEDNEQKFAVLKNGEEYYSLNFSMSEEAFVAEEELVALADYTEKEEPQFSLEKISEFEGNLEKEVNQQIDDILEGEEFKKKDEEEKEDDATDNEEEKCPKCGKPKDECTCEDEEEEDKKKKYNLEEVAEYTELMAQYSDLEQRYNALVEEKTELEAQLQPLVEFKQQAERTQKEELIASFYMLSDEDKQDVKENIDKYSLDDIEAKLSIICVRNKVNFNLEDETEDKKQATTFNLDDEDADTMMPAWVKAALKTAKNM